MTATKQYSTVVKDGWLYLALELGWSKWKLAFTSGPQQRARLREIDARDLEALQREIDKAKVRFGLAPEVGIRSCFEAGRDGFWLHRWLIGRGVDNVVVDAGSMKVNGRRKRAKTDRLDARMLLGNLLDYHNGRKDVWSVVRVPSCQEEDRRQLHRDMETVQGERTAHINRLKGLLATVGVCLPKVSTAFPKWLPLQRQPDGQALPPELVSRLLREFARWQLTEDQCRELEMEQQRRIAQTEATDPVMNKVRCLLGLKGIGPKSAWLLTMELFGWRAFRNRREVGSLSGLTPTPYDSGASERDQGISKVGNRRVRGLAVEVAWGWLRYQPDSVLSRWYMERFGRGSARQRKIGIVATARKLLVALWQYVERGQMPGGALATPWKKKLRAKLVAAAA